MPESEERGMQRTVAQLNIDHFRKRLSEEADDAKRQMLQKLLAEEEARLAKLTNPTGE